jgi:hypothetical protein
MPSVNDLYPDEWLKAHHLQDGDQTLTIKADGSTTFTDKKTGKDRPQIVLYFRETELKLGLNGGNARALADVFEDDNSTAWIGKRIVVGCAKANTGVEYVQVREGPTKAANRAKPVGRFPNQVGKPAPAVTQAEADGDDIGDIDADIPF